MARFPEMLKELMDYLESSAVPGSRNASIYVVFRDPSSIVTSAKARFHAPREK